MAKYRDIKVDGASTGAKLNLERRFDLMRRYLDIENKEILDMGCGDGRYVLKFLDYSPRVRGVDFSEAAVQEYQRDADRPELISQGDIQELPFEDNRFDVVLLNEVLEHVPNDNLAVAEAWRVLKPGAWLVVFSPNRLYPFETHGAEIKKTRSRLPHYFPFVPYIPLSLGHCFLTYRARNYFPWELKSMILTQPFDIVAQTYIWQTFENISGKAPRWTIALSRMLRAISFAMEKVPVIKRFGVSQVVLAKKKC